MSISRSLAAGVVATTLSFAGVAVVGTASAARPTTPPITAGPTQALDRAAAALERVLDRQAARYDRVAERLAARAVTFPEDAEAYTTAADAFAALSDRAELLADDAAAVTTRAELREVRRARVQVLRDAAAVRAALGAALEADPVEDQPEG
jgi:hypothetical protein